MMSRKEIEIMNEKILSSDNMWGFDDISEDDFEGLSEEAQKKLDSVLAAMQPDRWCASCQHPIPEGNAIRVNLEKMTRNERVWFACSEECRNVLRRE